MKLVNGYYVDENGNKWSQLLETLDSAERNNKTLTNCFNCKNCSAC